MLPHEPDAALKAKLEALIGGLWDAGLEPGHGVRTIEECVSESAKDITVQTSLLEARWLAGSRSLFTDFNRAMREQLNPQAFFQSKRLEQEQRYGKFQESPYSLEPNLKEAPGGLRDLQAILWISRAAGLGDDWMQLAARELITAAEARQLASYQKFLSELRIRLHYIAGRREDRLLFDYQSGLAAQFGYTDTPTKRASEQLMQRYYRTAKAITQLNTLLLQNIAVQLLSGEDAEPEILNERFQATHELLEARDPALFERQPGAILESFLLLQQHHELKGMSAPTMRALWRARARIDARFRRDPANRALFLQILQQPQGLVHALRRMNQYSILGRYLPGIRQDRRADAIRSVPRLYRGPAHPYRGPQSAPLHHGRVRPRVPAVQPPDGGIRAPLAAVRRGACSTTSPRAAAAITPSWACRTLAASVARTG